MAIIDTLKLALSALEESVDLVRQDYAMTPVMAFLLEQRPLL